jgi:phage-related protein
MSSVNTFLTPSSASTAGVSAARKTPTAFDINSQEFGPAGATMVGVAAAATDAASETVSFSGTALKKLGEMAGSAIDSVENAFTGAGKELSSIGNAIENDVKKAYGAVSDTVSSVASKVESAASSAEDEVSSVASSIGDAASYVGDGISSAADTVTHYIAAGLNALA